MLNLGEGYVKAHCIILFFCIELKISKSKVNRGTKAKISRQLTYTISKKTKENKKTNETIQQ